MSRSRPGGMPTFYNGTGGGYYGSGGNVGYYGNGNKTHSREDRTLSITFARGDGDKHCSGIQSLLYHDGSLYSASRDSTVKRWSARDDHIPVFRANYEGHSDWVNDIALVEQHLASASSDRTVKLWNPDKKTCILTLDPHADYVSCLTSVPGHSILVSAGLRSEIFMYDIEHNARSSRRLFPPEDAEDKGSVYSLVMDASARILAAGSRDAVIRLFDIREGSKTMKLKGHTENVRCLAMNTDGTRLLSGSSDHSIKLWDLRHQRCVQTFHVHSDSVWTILANDSFDVVFSGGRDKCVFKTNLANRNSELLFSEDEPIHCIVRSGSEGSLWIATASSSIKKWTIPSNSAGEMSMWPTMESTNKAVPGRAFLIAGTSSRRSSDTVMNLAPLQNRPSQIIEGYPAIIEHVVLNDQCRILTKDKVGDVTLWNITTGCEIEHYGNVDLQKKAQELHQYRSVPKWFATDKKLGQITLVLKTPQCFEAELYAMDLGIDASDDRRLNFGDCMLKGVLGRWAMDQTTRSRDATADNVDVLGTSWLDRRKKRVPCFRFWDDQRARVFVSGIKRNREPWKISVSDIDEEFNCNGELPDWVVDCVQRGHIPPLREWKCSFQLIPYDDSIPQINQSKLNAPRILQIKKVAVYLKQKLVDLDPPCHVNVVAYDVDPESQADSEETGSYADEMDLDVPDVELLCNGEAVPAWMSLAAVLEYLWKSPQDLRLYYRVRTESPASAPHLTPRKI